MTDWYDRHDDLLLFGHVLAANMLLQDAEAVLYYFEKPWKWNREHAIWERHNCPQDGDATYPAFAAELFKYVLS